MGTGERDHGDWGDDQRIMFNNKRTAAGRDHGDQEAGPWGPGRRTMGTRRTTNEIRLNEHGKQRQRNGKLNAAGSNGKAREAREAIKRYLTLSNATLCNTI